MSLQRNIVRGRSFNITQTGRGPMGYFINLAQQVADKCDKNCGRGGRGKRCRKKVRRCEEQMEGKMDNDLNNSMEEYSHKAMKNDR